MHSMQEELMYILAPWSDCVPYRKVHEGQWSMMIITYIIHTVIPRKNNIAHTCIPCQIDIYNHKNKQTNTQPQTMEQSIPSDGHQRESFVTFCVFIRTYPRCRSKFSAWCCLFKCSIRSILFYIQSMPDSFPLALSIFIEQQQSHPNLCGALFCSSCISPYSVVS